MFKDTHMVVVALKLQAIQNLPVGVFQHAFNFFVISGVSIYAVHEDNDERDEDEIEEDGTPPGVKKIYDMGVFTITCTCSMLAYIWTFYCLIDYEVTMLEAWLTLGFMVVLLISAYSADRCKAA